MYVHTHPYTYGLGTSTPETHHNHDSVQQALGLLVAGELFSLEGLQKHRYGDPDVCVRPCKYKQ